MQDTHAETQQSTINLGNVFYALFKRKWTVLAFLGLGLVVAGFVYVLYPRSYESDATLLVRYVLERSAVDPESTAGGSIGTEATKTNDTFIKAEVAILKSWDLAVEVAQAMGPKAVLPDAKGNPSVLDAAGAIAGGLTVTSTKNSNIILVSYSSGRPEVATRVLNELVSRYFTKHLEVHRSAGAFDFVSQQADEVRARLGQTEDALKALKAKVGITDLKGSTGSLNLQLGKLEDQIRLADSEVAEQRARVKLMEGAASPGASGSSQVPSAPVQPSAADVEKYKAIETRVGQLRQAELDLLSKYTDASVQVQSVRSQISDLEKEKQGFEKKFPGLATLGQPNDLANERTKLAGLEAKAQAMRQQLSEVQDKMNRISDLTPQIAQLERTKELEENNYKYFEATLEKARVDEALDPSKMPNISAVQRPSPAALVTKTRDKISIALALGGLCLGLLFGPGVELFLNRAVKRPTELERQLRAPLFLSIPYNGGSNGHLRLRDRLLLRNGAKPARNNTKPEIAPWESGHFIRAYAAAIRDRLSLHFELHGITHKPKLVGVTGLNEGAGASTLAAALAAALSETGEGKVLFVDANVANGKAEPFFAGRPALPLSAAIGRSDPAPAGDNLYLATIAAPNAHPAQIGFKKFFALMPNLKASDFDYIIFDMPPLEQTSPTVALAGFMDKLLLVVEAEKNSTEVVKRAYRDLVSARADVAVILNKLRSRVPKWLEQAS